MRHKKRKKRRSPDLQVIEQDIPDDDTSFRVDLTIAVRQAYNLRAPHKSSKLTTLVRYTRFGGLPGAGDEVVSSPAHDSVSPAIDLVTTYTGVAVSEDLLNAIVMAPLEFEVLEVVKKHKVPLGVCSVSLAPLLAGETSIDVVVPLDLSLSSTAGVNSSMASMHGGGIGGAKSTSKISRAAVMGGGPSRILESPTTTAGGYDDDDGGYDAGDVSPRGPGEGDEAAALLGGHPGLAVSITVSAPLLELAAYEASRVASLGVAGIYALPKSLLAPEPGYRFTLTASLPSEARVPQVVVIPDCEVVMRGRSDPASSSGQRDSDDDSFISSHDSSGASARALAAVGLDTGLESRPGVLLPEEQAALNTARRYAHAELKEPFVDTSLLAPRVFLGPEASEKLHALAKHGIPLRLELRRALGPQHTGVVDPNEARYAAECLLNLDPFLEPGTTQATIRAALVPLPPERLAVDGLADAADAEPSGRSGGDKGSHGHGHGHGHGSTRSGSDRRRGRGKSSGSSGSRSKKEANRLELLPEDPASPNPYTEAGSYVKVTLEVSKPIVPRPPTPKPVYSVRDFVPARKPPALPPRPLLSAPDEFKTEIEAAIDALVDSYRKVYGEQLLSGEFSATPDAVEDRKNKFVYELNHTGAYFWLKEKLKGPVVRIVREKFQRTSPFASKAETQTFLNDLYMYLVDRMHEALNGMFSSVHEIPIPTTVEDTSTLKRYAAEAEINGAYDLAARHYQERIARSSQNVEFWYDYGVFCLRVNDNYKADECFREGISLDDQHVASLMVYGMLCASRDKFPPALTMLNAAIDVDRSPIALAYLSLVTSLVGDADEADQTWQSAEALYEGNDDGESLAIAVARSLLAVHLPVMAERAVAREVLASGVDAIDVRLSRAEMFMQETDYDSARVALDGLVGEGLTGSRGARVFALWGHLLLIDREFDGAQDAYEQSLAFFDKSTDSTNELLAVYLRLGSLYVTKGQYADAKFVYLKACQLSPSSFTWLGVGVSCYRLGELDQAEDALAEANILNNFDADVWGYLTLVCLRTERVTEGDQAFMQALKLDLANGLLLTEIGEAYFVVGRNADAEQCLRRSIELEESAHAHRVLAQVLNAQGQKEGAVAEYMMVLASADDDDDLAASRAGLVDILTRLGRVEQAEFYAKEIDRVRSAKEAKATAAAQAVEDEKRRLAVEFSM